MGLNGEGGGLLGERVEQELMMRPLVTECYMVTHWIIDVKNAWLIDIHIATRVVILLFNL